MKLCDKCQRKTFGRCPDDCLSMPRLNAGSGQMLKKEYINYDMKEWTHHGMITDVIGTIETITDTLPTDFFAEILNTHVIEHFREADALVMLADFHKLLRPGGKLILEGPDVLGAYWYYIEKKNDPGQYIECLFAEANRLKYGDEMAHRSGWTCDIAAKALRTVGFTVIHKGFGMTHGMGRRDFRVEGLKK